MSNEAQQLGQRILVLAPFGRDAFEVCRVLSDARLDAVRCTDAEALCREIPRGAAAALLAEEALDDEVRRRLTATLAGQPAWSDFPLLVMISQSRKHGDPWQAVRGIEGTAYLSLIERPLHVSTLVSTVRTATQARRRQYQIRDELAARQRAEETLRASEERYRTLFESIDEGFCIVEVLFDASGKPMDYRFLEANPAFVGQTGLHDAVGRRIRKLVPHHEEHWFETYGRIALTGAPERFTSEAKQLNRWYDVYAFRVGRPEERKVAVLFNDISARKEAEEALHQLNLMLEERVEERTQQVKGLISALTLAEQEERRRISQILHDNLQQQLYGIQMKMSFAKQEAVAGQQEKLVKNLAESQEWLGQAIDITRTLTVDLSPPILQNEGLTDTLRWLVGRMQELHGLEVELVAEHAFRTPDEDMRVLLFQIVRELLFNVAKHAGTNRAIVELLDLDNHVQIQVRDEGQGFDTAAAEAADKDGFGLFSVRERLRLFGGDLKIDSSPGEGTRNTIIVPLRLE